MSFLNFSDEDSLSKRQRQQVFRHTLDEQRRVNQELRQQQKEQQHRGQSHNVSAPRPLRSAVPGSPVLDDDSNRVIPGLELACSSTEAPDRPSSGGKQPYMSALSEMNGRPLHVRQKQFEKESQYRNMLRDQIEENKRRKEAEKAKLEEEKRTELEEIRRLYGPAPRRQQHPQFQESPDHPLPSPGRLPPASYQQQLPKQPAAREMAPAYGTADADQYSSRDPPPRRGDQDAGTHWRSREERDHVEARDRRGEGGFLSPDLPGYPHQHPQQHSRTITYSAADDLPQEVYPRERRAPYPGDKFNNTTSARSVDGAHGHRARDGYREGGAVLNGDQRNPAPRRPDDRGQEATARILALHGAGSGRPTVPEGAAGSIRTARDEVDLVPRSDFEELTSLCRELLLEQRELRRKLEEREERGRLGDHSNQQQQTRGTSKPRRGSMGLQKPVGSGGSSARGDGVGRKTSGARSLPGQATKSRIQGERQWGNVARRDPGVKPGVAFGSSVPRMKMGSKVEQPRVGFGSSQVARNGVGVGGDRDLRTSKSEPVHGHRNTSNSENGGGTLLRRHRTAVSSDGAVTGGALFDNQRGSEPAWARESGRNRSCTSHVSDGVGPRDRGSRRPPPGGEQTNRPMGRWEATREDDAPRDHSSAHHRRPAVEGVYDGTTAAGGTTHGLLGKNGPRISSSLAADSGDLAAEIGDNRRNSSSRGGAGEIYDELGGESTFLAALPGDPGMGMGDGSLGRNGESAFWDPREAADPWAARR